MASLPFLRERDSPQETHTSFENWINEYKKYFTHLLKWSVVDVVFDIQLIPVKKSSAWGRYATEWTVTRMADHITRVKIETGIQATQTLTVQIWANFC